MDKWGLCKHTRAYVVNHSQRKNRNCQTWNIWEKVCPFITWHTHKLLRSAHVSTHYQHTHTHRADNIHPSWRLYYIIREGHCSLFLWHIMQKFSVSDYEKSRWQIRRWQGRFDTENLRKTQTQRSLCNSVLSLTNHTWLFSSYPRKRLPG